MDALALWGAEPWLRSKIDLSFLLSTEHIYVRYRTNNFQLFNSFTLFLSPFVFNIRTDPAYRISVDFVEDPDPKIDEKNLLKTDKNSIKNYLKIFLNLLKHHLKRTKNLIYLCNFFGYAYGSGWRRMRTQDPGSASQRMRIQINGAYASNMISFV